MGDAQRPGQVVDVNYFVCTLGQAAALNAETPHSFETVNEFIDHHAHQYPSRPAFGFPIPPKDKETGGEWNYAVYSKSSLHIHHLEQVADSFDISFPRFTTVITIPRTEAARTWSAVATSTSPV